MQDDFELLSDVSLSRSGGWFDLEVLVNNGMNKWPVLAYKESPPRFHFLAFLGPEAVLQNAQHRRNLNKPAKAKHPAALQMLRDIAVYTAASGQTDVSVQTRDVFDARSIQSVSNDAQAAPVS